MEASKYSVFLKVAETGSISRAAEALQYTQSGVSHAIKALERELDIKLFIRKRNGVELTENGRRVIPYVRALLRDEQDLKAFTYNINNKVEGRLRVGSFSSVTGFWMPDAVVYFQQHYPDVELEILDGNYDEIRQWILQGVADLGFLSSIAADGLKFQPLYDDPLCVIMPKGHPLEQAESVCLDEVCRYPMILETPGCDNDIVKLLEENGKHPPSRFNFRDDFEIAAFVERGIGISITQELVQKSIHADLVVKPLSFHRVRTIGIGRLKTQNSLLSSLFLRYMQDYLAH